MKMKERLHQFVRFGERLRESYPHPALKVPFFIAAMLIFAISVLVFHLLGDRKEEVGVLGHIGIGLKNGGKPGLAIAAMQRCLEVAKQHQAEPEFLSIYYGEIGDLQVMLGRPAEGLADLLIALQFAGELDKCRRHYQIAEAYLKLGSLEAADQHLAEAKRLVQAGLIVHPSRRVGAILVRAKYWYGLGARNEALHRARKALALAEELHLSIRVEQAKALIAQIEGNP